MKRTVVHGDALAWLEANDAPPATSVLTSLPDVSELGELGFDGWRAWFVSTAARVIRWIPDDAAAIFFQSDVRRAGALVDKGYLVLRAAEEAGAAVAWHKIVCRKPPGTQAFGRPTYSHMIAVVKVAPLTQRHPGPDVIADGGRTVWTRGMGVGACEVACRWLADETATRTVVDPFCGQGTALAVANALGFDAIGVERSAKRCRAARTLVVTELGCAPARR